MKKNRTKSKKKHPPVKQRHVSVQLSLPLLAETGSVREGFFALCVRAGMAVLQEMMEQDRARICGAPWSRDPGREAVRTGSAAAEVTLGGRRVPIRRPRAGDRQGEEVTLASYAWAAARDPLEGQTWDAVVSGVSTRNYARSLESLPQGVEERATSKSAVSRRFVALSQKRLRECLGRSLEEIEFRVVMIDGIVFRDHAVLVALGIDSGGNKHVLGLREGTTENSGVARALLSDLIRRGLSTERRLLFVIDGAGALRKAIRESFGSVPLVQRCQVHKIRNVLDHLPEEYYASVRKAMREAYGTASVKLARKQLLRLADSLRDAHPGAAASLEEGLDETLTLQELGFSEGALWATLRSTNPIESLNGGIAKFTRNVKRWRGGSMILRWVGSAVLEAETRFRRVRGHRQMKDLIRALDAETVTRQSRAAKRTA